VEARRAPDRGRPMTTGIGLVLDCVDPQPLAEFWAPALGYTNLGTAGSHAVLIDERGGPKLLLQGVPERRPSRTACTSTSRPPTSTAKPPASNPSAPAGSTPNPVTSTGATGS